MPDFYIDGQSLGNQQRGQPRRAKIAVAFKEKPTAGFELHWEEIGDRTNNEAEYYALIKALNMIQEKWPELGAAATRKGVEPVMIYSDSLLIVVRQYEQCSRRCYPYSWSWRTGSAVHRAEDLPSKDKRRLSGPDQPANHPQAPARSASKEGLYRLLLHRRSQCDPRQGPAQVDCQMRTQIRGRPIEPG